MDENQQVADSDCVPGNPLNNAQNGSVVLTGNSRIRTTPSDEIRSTSMEDPHLSGLISAPWSWSSANRPTGTYRMSDFETHRTLGIGSFGRVYLVRSKYNLHYYVIKVLNKKRIVDEGRISHARNERALLQAVDHPLIIRLWGAFQDPAHLYMVMEYIPGGELFTLLERSQLHRFPEPTAKFYAAEVALALNYLHSLDIIYRDLKPENILINIDGHIKLADFGFAKHCSTVTYTFCGTSEYMAPEIVRQAPYNKSVDWYALGVLIFEMLSGHPPFYDSITTRLDVLYDRIQQGTSTIRWPSFLSLPAIDLILKLMDRDPSRRYGNLRHGAGDVFAHSWFAEVNWVKLASREYPAPYLPVVRHAGDSSAFKPFADDSAQISGVQPSQDEYGHHFPDFDYSAM